MQYGFNDSYDSYVWNEDFMGTKTNNHAYKNIYTMMK
jgi:hypothetical protein